ncbi:hypothetical protein [Kitasatospora sp. NPDC059327]|uniref:hypothetical protein n=1 Tax=Kitasatospora sp. NPDC059327 TaxID=3346803 RepID=UPI00368E09AE
MVVSLPTRPTEGHTVETLYVELATELVVRGSTGPARRRPARCQLPVACFQAPT